MNLIEGKSEIQSFAFYKIHSEDLILIWSIAVLSFRLKET